MLIVDPVKRITVPEIIQHPFFQVDLPRYLQPLPPPPGPVLGTLSALVTPGKALDFEMIDGLGRIEDDVVEELALRMEGVEKEDVWACLRREDGVQGNAVKVAYMLLRDKRRLGRDCEHLPFFYCVRPYPRLQSRHTRSRNVMRKWPSWTYVHPL
jgi:carbon catabolite-derepressing protein kinase